MRLCLKAVTFAAAVLIPSASWADWSFQQKDDPFEDEKVLYALTKQRYGADTRSLVVRCNTDHEIDIYVDFDEYIGKDGSDVKYRIDDDPVREEFWQPSTDGSSLFFRQGYRRIDGKVYTTTRLFARKLRKGHKFAVRTWDYQGTSKTVEFSLRGSAKAIGQLLDRCPPREG